MRLILVAALLLTASASALLPTASAACAEGPQDRWCVAEDRGGSFCLASIQAPSLDQCVVLVGGSFDPTGYYLVVCAAEGDVDVCFTDSDTAPKCVQVQRWPVCTVE